MPSQERQSVQQPTNEPTGCLPAILRITWMIFGNFLLFMAAALVAMGTAPIVMDVVFFAVVLGLITIRYVDIVKFKGQTSEGAPATLSHWRRYAVIMVIVSAAVWALARVADLRNWM